MNDELKPVSPNPVEKVVEDEPVADGINNNGKKRPSSGWFWRTLQKTQRYSSYGFSAFVAMHTASVVFTPALSPELGNSTLGFTKAVYQEQLLEPALVYIPLTVHIASGALLRIHKNYLHRKHYGTWPSPSKIWGGMSTVARSGIVMTPFILGHIWGMRITPMSVLGDSSSISLDFVAHWIHNYPIKMWLVYPFMMGGLLYHIVMGWRKWMGAGKSTVKFAYAGVGAMVTCGVISFIRIARMPQVTGWMAKQFNQVLEVSL